MNGRTTKVRMDDGATLQVQVLEGEGRCVVLLHDLGCAHGYWEPVVARLRELDPSLAILVPDLRGHGGSTMVEPPSRKRLLKDLKRLCREFRVDAPILCGHGWGADIALASDLASAVVAVNPLMGRAAAPFTGDVERPLGMAGAQDEATLQACLFGATTAKPLRRSRRDSPLLLVYSQDLDSTALSGSEVLQAAAETLAWQDASRHLPLEAPNAIAALLWSWIEETS